MLDEEKKAIEMIEHIQECNTLIGYRVEESFAFTFRKGVDIC